MPINHKFYMCKRQSLRILLMFAMVFSWHFVLCQSSSFELGISGGGCWKVVNLVQLMALHWALMFIITLKTTNNSAIF